MGRRHTQRHMDAYLEGSLPAAADALGLGGDVAARGVLMWGHGASLTSRRAAGAGVARRTAPGVACAIFHWHDADHA